MCVNYSVDDDSFLETMEFDGSSFAHDNNVHEVEEEYAEVDEEGEGMVGAPTGRKINYTVDEDVLLCKTWLKIGMDPSIGTDQSRDTYWIRMKEYFDANTVELIARAALFGLVGRSSTKIVQGGQVRKRRLMISTQVAPTIVIE